MQDLLVFKPFDVVGRHSYGIYLWHWPLWLFTKAMFPQWGARHLGWMLLITFALTACCTAMSWKLVEQPVARGGFIAMIRPLPENGMWDAARCWITIVVVLSTCMMSGYAVTHAPQQTSVERVLSENARILKEQQKQQVRQESHADISRNEAPKPRKPIHTMPDGGQMVAFGDSVMVGFQPRSTVGVSRNHRRCGDLTFDGQGFGLGESGQNPAGWLQPVGAGRSCHKLHGDR